MFSRSLSSLSISESTLSKLQRAGFQNVDDLGTSTADQLSEELKIPAFLCEEILRDACRTTALHTQPATSLLNATRSAYSISEPVDVLLGDGGLNKGCIIELSGPPGSPKEESVLQLIKSVSKNAEEVLFVDTQNMIVPSIIRSTLKDVPGSLDQIHYVKCFSLVELLAFMYNLSSILDQYPKTSLLVLNTLSFLFQTTPLTNASRSSLFDQIRTNLSKICATRNLTVAVTVQLATKMVGADGSAANFDTAKRAVVAPQLGDSYLPSSRSYRLIFIPDSPVTGMVRLLAAPGRPAKSSQTVTRLMGEYAVLVDRNKTRNRMYEQFVINL